MPPMRPAILTSTPFAIEQHRDLRLDNLAHRIARKGSDASDRAGQFVIGEKRTRESLQIFESDLRPGTGLDRNRDALSPFVVFQTDHGAVADAGMTPHDFFDFERGDFVAAGLEDVGAAPAKQTERAGFDHRDVAGAEPAVAECRDRLLGPPPVLEKDGAATDFKLARVPG